MDPAFIFITKLNVNTGMYVCKIKDGYVCIVYIYVCCGKVVGV